MSDLAGMSMRGRILCALSSTRQLLAGDAAEGSEAGYDSEYEEEASFGDHATVPATVAAEDRQEDLATLPYLAALSPLPPPAWLENMRHWLPAEPTSTDPSCTFPTVSLLLCSTLYLPACAIKAQHAGSGISLLLVILMVQLCCRVYPASGPACRLGGCCAGRADSGHGHDGEPPC